MPVCQHAKKSHQNKRIAVGAQPGSVSGGCFESGPSWVVFEGGCIRGQGKEEVGTLPPPVLLCYCLSLGPLHEMGASHSSCYGDASKKRFLIDEAFFYSNN